MRLLSGGCFSKHWEGSYSANTGRYLLMRWSNVWKYGNLDLTFTVKDSITTKRSFISRLYSSDEMIIHPVNSSLIWQFHINKSDSQKSDCR